MSTYLLLQTEGEAPLTPQDRLEKVWSSLEMPDGLKLDMAIKYSCNEFYIRLNEVGMRLQPWARLFKTNDVVS